MAYFGPFKCCSLRIFVFAIGILFLLVQTTFLIVTFVLMRDIETHVAQVIDWFTEKGVDLKTIAPTCLNSNDSFASHRNCLIKVSFLSHRD